jgi:hypothetical protein
MGNKPLIALLIICISFFSTSVKSQTSVIDYTNKHDMNDTFHLAGVYQRCSELTLAYGTYLPIDMQQQKNLYGKYAQDFGMEAGVLLISRGQETSSSVVNTVKESMLYFKDVFYPQIKKTQIDTGSIFEGRVAEDLQVCGALYKNIKK